MLTLGALVLGILVGYVGRDVIKKIIDNVSSRF